MRMRSPFLRRASRRLTKSNFLNHLWVMLIIGTLVTGHIDAQQSKGEPMDNEFAEFEEFDDPSADTPVVDEVHHEQRQQQQQRVPDMTAEFDDDTEGMIEEEDDFSHFADGEEFENFKTDYSDSQKSADGGAESTQLKFADVPAHLRNNWSNYQVELLMIVALVIYLINYMLGRQSNQAIATQWFEAHADLLNENFALVGDDGTTDEATRAQFVKETDSTISLWCSGRAGVLGMLVQIKLIKRQDLLSVLAQFVRPAQDHVAIRIEMEPSEMDTFVTAIGQRKAIGKLAKDMTDLSLFTSEKKNAAQYGLPAAYTVFSEIAEATNAMLDPKVISMVNKYAECLEYVHWSDQYCGLKPQEGETLTRQPETSSVLVLGYNLTHGALEDAKPLMQLALHCTEKARRFRMSQEGKQKANRNRQAAQETFLKTTHAQRAEAAAARKEEKIRERKQRVLEEVDPEKQRRLEKQEQKREAKRNAPRMKQLKVKNG